MYFCSSFPVILASALAQSVLELVHAQDLSIAIKSEDAEFKSKN